MSYLNAKPLLAGLEDGGEASLWLGPPFALRPKLESGQTDAALLPVFDAIDAGGELTVVPAGGIGCDGPTLTVRLFSRVPLARVRRVALDTDSRTSVNLLRVLLAWRGIEAAYEPWTARSRPTRDDPDADAVLLIGDKVVTARPDAAVWPVELDLGEAWRDVTGLPFVFAAWTVRRGTPTGHLDRLLRQARHRGEREVGAIAQLHAEAHGWPLDLARRYLGRVLRYRIGPRQVEAMRRYGRVCAELGLTTASGSISLARPADPDEGQGDEPTA